MKDSDSVVKSQFLGDICTVSICYDVRVLCALSVYHVYVLYSRVITFAGCASFCPVCIVNTVFVFFVLPNINRPVHFACMDVSVSYMSF